jgi:hypothetical protein
VGTFSPTARRKACFMDSSWVATIDVRFVSGLLRRRGVAPRTQPAGLTLVLTVALLTSLIPHSALPQEATPVADAVAGMPLEVKIGQMILAGVQDETVGEVRTPATSSMICTLAISS